MEGSPVVEGSMRVGGSGEGLLGPNGRLSEECCDRERVCREGDPIGASEFESGRVVELRVFVFLEARDSGRRGGSSVHRIRF